MRSQELRDFEINFIGLDNSSHHFEFQINNHFFHHFPDSLVEEGEGEAILDLEKSETMMQLHFTIQVKVELTCDVSLEKFLHPVEVRKDLIVKFGEEDEELSDEITVLHWDSTSINVGKYIYEFVSLGIPMKKLHPDIEEQDRNELAYSDTTDNENSTPNEDNIDPRWEALKKLKK